MEVFDQWQVAEVVNHMMTICMNVAMMLITAFLMLRLAIELFRVWAFQGMRFSAGPFISMLVGIIALLCYDQIMPQIGDAFFGLGYEIRGEAEHEFRLTNLWDALKAQLAAEGETGEPQDTWELIQAWGKFILNKVDPIDGIQNYFGLATSLTWQLLAIALRWFMIIFKNIVYGLMLAVGPIPIVLSLIPGWQGLSAHWMKNFIVVCSWNVSLAFVDGFMQGLNMALWTDILLGGDEEMSIGMLTAFTAIMYLFVPFITSLWVGQTVVAMAGSKFVMTPLAAAMGIMKMAAGAASGGTTVAAGAAGSAATGSAGAAGAGKATGSALAMGESTRNSSGLISMANPKNQPVRSSYDFYAPSTSATPKQHEYYASVTQATKNSQSAGVLPASHAQLPGSQELPSGNQRQSTSLPASRGKAKYLLGPKK